MTQTTEISAPDGVEVVGALQDGFEAVLTNEALAFVAGLHREFNARRQELLARRDERQVEFDNGACPISSPTPRKSASAPGKSHRRPKTSSSAGPRSPVRSTAR